jgi:hypothetical protein
MTEIYLFTLQWYEHVYVQVHVHGSFLSTRVWGLSSAITNQRIPRATPEGACHHLQRR